ncbi:trypsin-like peptidase domain-containing protein [Streptomyces scopuliridis]|uniref:Trypsin-like peptidase domain-containing protein n=1 Tax=Streptomyces scopuliridis TaxID=452529 RepID=A0ACD4ZCC1_9ACTN|nr:trypsin-like peptidase domain-containing protein [Streptomyces scopuliridis]WSB96054.1 trypsin-like peptidase domain-containing protein [Streptomyces scopuliridis]WSC10240.1 trypsin-like peptidase domain-containing protein [Streptomyces scopuliridis]
MTAAETGTGAGSRSPEEALAAAVVRVKGPGGELAGAGFLVAPELVLTCAHVVNDALDRPREDEVAAGTEVFVDLPFAEGGSAAEVERWVPVRSDQTGDIAVLRLRAAIPGTRPLNMADTERVWGHDVRVPGFPRRSPGGVWHYGRLRGGTAEGWVQLSQADPHGVPVEEGFSGSPVWDEQLRAVAGMVVVIQPGGVRQSFLIPTRTLVAELPELAPVVRPASPFRGLSTFQEADADVYFGRQDDIADVTALLAGSRPCVTLIGPSGCGKSSLARAGVVPRMRERGHTVLVVRSGEGTSLRAALASELVTAVRPRLRGAARAQEVRQLEELLAERGLMDVLRMTGGEGERGLFVLLDQGEELLTGPDREVEEAVRLLFPAHQPEGLRVCVTLSSGFTDAALSHPLLAPALGRGQVRPLAPMSRAQLEQVIRRPLEATPAVTYDDGLVERLLDDAGDGPGALPLLGFVMAQLWDGQASGRLRFDTYREVGGVQGALGRYAETVWRQCVREADETEAMRLLTDLVRFLPGDETPIRNVLSREEAGAGRWRIATALAERRLLVLRGGDGEPVTVELAHEALIGAWKRLEERVRQDRKFLAWRAELRHDVERGQLLEGEPLAEAERWVALRGPELTDTERQFIDRSVGRRVAREERARRRVRQKQWFIGGLAVLTVLAAVASGLFLWRNAELDGQLRRAASEQLAVRAEQLDDVSVVTSALFSGAAYRTAQEPAARAALIRQYLRLRHVERVVWDNHAPVRDVAMSEDGKRINVGMTSGDAVGLTLGTDEVHERGLPTGSRIVTLSPDGRISARASVNGKVSLGISPEGGGGGDWRTVVLRDGDAVRENARAAVDLRFDGTGRRVLAALPGEGVLAWETESGRRVGKALRAPKGWETAEAWFGPEGTVVGRITQAGAAEGAEGRLVRWSLDNGQRDSATWGTDRTAAVTVSGDGRTLVRCTPEGLLQSWDLTGRPKVRHQYSTRQLGLVCPLNVPRLDRSGRFLINPVQRFGASLGRFRFLVLDLVEGRPGTLDLPAPAQQDESFTGSSQLPAVALTGPPEKLRAAVGVGGTVIVARVPEPSAFDSAMLTAGIRTVDADHNRVISVDADGKGLRLWDLRTHRMPAAVRPSRPLASVYSAYSPDGTRVLTPAADGRTVLVWEVGGSTLKELDRIDLPWPPGIDPTGPDPRSGRTPAWVNITFDGPDHVVISALSYVMRWDLAQRREAGTAYRPRAQESVEVSFAAAGTWAVARPGHGQAAVRTPDGKYDIVIWDFEEGREVGSIDIKEFGAVKQLGFDPTGRLLAVLTYDGAVRVWDMDKKGEEKWLKPLAYQGVQWLGAFASESTLSTQSTLNEYTTWDIRSGTERYHFTPGYGATADLTEDGAFMGLVDGSDGHILELDPERWLEKLCAVAGRGLSPGEKSLAPPGSRTDEVCD